MGRRRQPGAGEVTALLRRLLVAVAAVVAGCAVTGTEGYGGSVSYIGGFYAPSGYQYGGWGPGYVVGPERGGGRRREYHDDRPAGGYQRAGADRRTPSIPQRSHR